MSKSQTAKATPTFENVTALPATLPVVTKTLVSCDRIRYTSEVKTATLGGRKIRLENLTPILSPDERDVRKREIENRLFEIFVKYTGRNNKN
jgi:hypothetical protein